MNKFLYSIRFSVVVCCAAYIAYRQQEPIDLPMVGYSALVTFVTLLTLGNLICKLWELKTNSIYYRFVALPLYPLIIIFAATAFFGELTFSMDLAILLGFVIYFLLVTVAQRGLLLYIGDIYKSQVTDHLLFPKNRTIQTRSDLVLTEAIINIASAVCFIYLIVRVFF